MFLQVITFIVAVTAANYTDLFFGSGGIFVYWIVAVLVGELMYTADELLMNAIGVANGQVSE